jgi:hypothetical protein
MSPPPLKISNISKISSLMIVAISDLLGVKLQL